MFYKFEYLNDIQRAEIIEQNKDKILIEEQNIFNEDKTAKLNFLIFSDIKPIENQLNDIKNNTDLIILKQEGII